MRGNYYLAEQTLHLQELYDVKIKVKRGVQNMLAQPVSSNNPVDGIEEMATRLEQYEAAVEANPDYRIDLWCGYVNSEILDVMLETAKAGSGIKPLTTFDASTKIVISIDNKPREVHACSSVLVYDYESKMVSVGRGNVEIVGANTSLMIPVIGVSISDNTNKIYDVDYVGVV